MHFAEHYLPCSTYFIGQFQHKSGSFAAGRTFTATLKLFWMEILCKFMLENRSLMYIVSRRLSEKIQFMPNEGVFAALVRLT
jgi:hypothetical protein